MNTPPVEGPHNHEFRLAIKGIVLPVEVVDRISRALQKTMMSELGSLDLAPSLGVRFIRDGDNQGIEVIAEREGPR